MPHTSSLGAQLQLEEKGNTKWNCHRFVPFVQGKQAASEAVGWLQSYHGLCASWFFLSQAWGGSVGADDLSAIVSSFHNAGTDTSVRHFVLCLRSCMDQAVVQPP